MKFRLLASVIILSAALVPLTTAGAQTTVKECAAGCFATLGKCQAPDSDGDPAGPNRRKRCMNEYNACLRQCSASGQHGK